MILTLANLRQSFADLLLRSSTGTTQVQFQELREGSPSQQGYQEQPGAFHQLGAISEVSRVSPKRQ